MDERKARIRSRLSRPSHGMVVAYLSLFFALGGTSYAFIVTGQLVQDESLTGADVRDDSLKGADLNEQSLGTVPSASVAGTARALDGFDSTTVVRELSQHREVGVWNSVSLKRASIVCPPGKQVVGVGGSISGGLTQGPDGQPYTHVAITAIEPSASGNEVFVWGAETAPTDVNWAVIAHATCARVD